jgi:hypothetical protein
MSDHQLPATNAPRRTWPRCFALATAAALTFAGGGAVIATSSTSATASADQASATYQLADDPLPAPGKAWIQGVITDQANHALDNVNVEVWPTDPNASEPVASNLTYAGTPADLRHQHGVFRVEVPMNVPYVIVLSGVRGAEDGDPYRMTSVGGGRPIMARSGTGAGTRLADGRVLDLGTFQLARQGRVSAKATADLAKKKVGTGVRARLRVTVSSKFVAAPTGKVVVHVGRKKITDRLRAADHGKTSIRLPRFEKPGKHQVRVTFPATSTIQRAASRPVVLRVR